MLWNWTSAFEDIETLRKEMNHLLERSQRYTGGNSNYPLLNLYNQDERVLIVAEVPGLAREDLDLQFVEGQLKLSGERKAPELGEKVAPLREERGFGRFSKTVRIPVEVDAERIEARLIDGLLEIELPKPAKIQPRQIAIKTA